MQPTSTLLTTLGLSGPEERLYTRVLPLSGSAVEVVAAALQVSSAALDAVLGPLHRLGLVGVQGGRVEVLSLTEAVATLMRREAESTGRAQLRLSRLAVAVPRMMAAATRPDAGEVDDVRRIEGELSSGGDPLQLLANLIAGSRGDLLWLRPDTWRMPRESAMVGVITAAVASGRRSRAIYPVLAAREAPDVLRARAQAGEQVRLVSELPTRLIIIGTTHAVVPEPLGFADEPRLLVRQGALVHALTLLFEQLWERAVPVSGLDLGEARPDLRRFLVQLLAAGHKDEQIARTLGLSLRTVRRRVADLMTELGCDSRFQAGVEATRRGWL